MLELLEALEQTTVFVRLSVARAPSFTSTNRGTSTLQVSAFTGTQMRPVVASDTYAYCSIFFEQIVHQNFIKQGTLNKIL